MALILVVDDEDEVRASLKRRLVREGYTVVTADSAEDAANKIRMSEEPFDAVVTDMCMEEADSGLEVLRHAVARDLFTEVIVLTAYGNVSNAVESMRRGAFDYLEKNVPGVDTYEVLVMKVAQALERRRAAIRTVRRLEERAAQQSGSGTA
ncbi:MAG: response regulator [Chthonomonadales bacterium]|nr:response regulator [Chthonomonadales bacterium]